MWRNKHLELVLYICTQIQIGHTLKNTIDIDYMNIPTKINRTLCFAYKINSCFYIALSFGGHHICPIHRVPCKFGKDIFDIKDTVLIFQKDLLFCFIIGRIHNFQHIMLCFGEIHI